MYGTWSLDSAELVAGIEARICVNFSCLRPRKPIRVAKSRASRRLPMYTLYSPLAWRHWRETTPNSSRRSWTSCASTGLRVEYEICTVLRGRAEVDPSPSNRAWRKRRLNAAPECHTKRGTDFAALRVPDRTPSGDALSLSIDWTSSSKRRWPEAITRL